LLNCCHFLLQNWLTELAAATGKRIVFYCAIADRSAMAVQAAQDAGLKTACHIAGGIGARKKADGPLAAVIVSGPTCFGDRI
jgi:rhodanese-related sulfurtransferase